MCTLKVVGKALIGLFFGVLFFVFRFFTVLLPELELILFVQMGAHGPERLLLPQGNLSVTGPSKLHECAVPLV